MIDPATALALVLNTTPVPVDYQQVLCAADVIYAEARSQPVKARIPLQIRDISRPDALARRWGWDTGGTADGTAPGTRRGTPQGRPDQLRTAPLRRQCRQRWDTVRDAERDNQRDGNKNEGRKGTYRRFRHPVRSVVGRGAPQGRKRPSPDCIPHGPRQGPLRRSALGHPAIPPGPRRPGLPLHQTPGNLAERRMLVRRNRLI